MSRMIAFSEGNTHDINHLMKVWGYARTIGCLEHLDGHLQFVTEVAAITHDIACPLCRRKYGNTDGKHQEAVGAPLVRSFLAGTDLEQADIDRVAYLVGHHHTTSAIDGMDYQILIEADYLVNADESHYSPEAIAHFRDHVFRTAAGKALLNAVYFPAAAAQ